MNQSALYLIYRVFFIQFEKGLHMEIAVLADLHSNYLALEVCLRETKKRNIENYIFLGDYAGELPHSQKTMSILHDLQKTANCTFIRGNREDYMLNYKKNGEKGWNDFCSASGALLNTYEELTEENLSFFDSLPIQFVKEYPDMEPILCCHGSPVSSNEYVVLESERAKEILEQSKVSYVLYGHTHIQGVTEYQGKFLINPGAVGSPINSPDAKAQFAILKSNQKKWAVELLSIEYPLEQCIEELYESDLPKRAPVWTRLTEYCLRFGVPEMSTQVLKRATEICMEREGECIWPDIPEKDWEQAAVEFEIDKRISECKR